MAISDLIEEKRKVSVASRVQGEKPPTKGGYITTRYDYGRQYNPYGATYTPKPVQQKQQQRQVQVVQRGGGEQEEVRIPEKKPSWVDDLVNRVRKIVNSQASLRDIQYPQQPIPQGWNIPAPYSWAMGRPVWNVTKVPWASPFSQRGWNVYGQRLSALAAERPKYPPGVYADADRWTSKAAHYLAEQARLAQEQQEQQQGGTTIVPWPNWYYGGGGGGWSGNYSEALRNWYNALMNWRI